MILSCIIFPVLLLSSGCRQTTQVKVTDEVVGNGQTVHTGDVVSVDYTGKLMDGSTFDTSVGKKPFMFMIGIGQVIPGLDAGMDGMKVGGRRVITIPPDLGYGDLAVQGIPAKSTLVFTIKLLTMEPKLQIDVQAKGKGTTAKFGDVVAVNITGGSKGGPNIFGTTGPNGPVPVKVVLLIGEGNLPFGFIPALVGMQEGEKRRVEIPAALAYGEKGIPKEDTPGQDGKIVRAGSIVAPNSPMEFTIELVQLNPDTPGKKAKSGS